MLINVWRPITMVESAPLALCDARTVRREDLWARIGLIPQKAFLFSGTIASNLRFGRPDATDDELWDALRIAQAETFVRDLEGALEAPVTQGGANLSGGQTICFEPRTGKELWRVKSEANQSTPVLVGNRMLTYGSSRRSGLRCYEISPTEAKEAWNYQRASDKGSSPVVVGGEDLIRNAQSLTSTSCRWHETQFRESAAADDAATSGARTRALPTRRPGGMNRGS